MRNGFTTAMSSDLLPEEEDPISADNKNNSNISYHLDSIQIQYVHPVSIESALSYICGVSTSGGTYGGASAGLLKTPSHMVSHCTREEISALA